MMHENAYANDFKDLEDLNLFRQEGTNINCINKFKFITTCLLCFTLKQKKQNELKYNKNGSSPLRMLPLWSDIGIHTPFLMKLSREL